MLRVALLSCVALSGLAAPAAAQTRLSGVIKDKNGRVAVDVLIVAVHDVTKKEFKTRSTEIGYYEFPKLPAGNYHVTVILGDFKPITTSVAVPLHARAVRDIDLEVRLETAVTVVPDRSFVAPLMVADGSVGAVFSRETIDTMSLGNGRTVQSMLAVVPGIVFTESVGTLAQFTAIGQRRLSNRLTIDGMNADLAVDALRGIGPASSGSLPAFSTLGGTQTLVPIAAVEEIQVRTTNAAPAEARTPGAQTSIITRAGSERFTGSAFGDSRPNGLAAADWFDNGSDRFLVGAPRHESSYWNNGVSVGGPIYPKRLLSFVTWERQHVDRSVEATVPTISNALRETAPATLRSLFAAFPYANGPEIGDGLAELSRVFPAISNLSTLSVRLDANLSTRHRAFARINYGRSSGDEVGLAQLPIFSFTQTEAASTTTATAGLTSTFSSWMHDLRVNITEHLGSLDNSPARYGAVQPLPLDLLVPNGSSTDAWVRFSPFIGPGGFLISGRTGTSSQKQVQVVDNWTFARGRHEWRMGFDYRQLTAASNPPPDQYIYQFVDVTQLLQGQIPRVTLTQFVPARARISTWSTFAQDTFRVTPRLSLNYGVRYSVKPAPANLNGAQPWLYRFEALPQFEPLPAGVSLWNTSWTNVAPQVAGTYQLGTTAGRETTVRAGWSLVFDELTSPGASVFGQGYPYRWRSRFRPSAFPVPSGELAVSSPDSFESTQFADAYAFPRDLKSPRTHEWQIAIDRALGQIQRLSVAYVGAAGRDLVYHDQYYLGDSNHIVQAFSNEASSGYHALLTEYARRLSRGLQARLVYTWSHAIDIDSGENDEANPPPSIVHPSSNRGSADFDRRHVLRLSASYQLPTPRIARRIRPILADWQIDVTGIVTSGGPVSVTFSDALGLDGFYGWRPDVVPGVSMWRDDPTSPTGRGINPDAFVMQTSARQGTLGRNTLRSSPLRQVDASLSRSVRLGGRAAVQVRLEAFNVFNVPNFGSPSTELGIDGFGQPFQTYAQALGTGTLAQGGLVPIQQVGGPRAVQVGVRVKW